MGGYGDTPDEKGENDGMPTNSRDLPSVQREIRNQRYIQDNSTSSQKLMDKENLYLENKP